MDKSTSHTLYIARMCHDKTYSIDITIFHSCCKSLFHSYAELMQLHLFFLMTNIERELPDFWLEMACTPTYIWEVRPFLQTWSGNNFLFASFMTVLSIPYLELSIKNWLAISFSGGVYTNQKSKVFLWKKKYRLLRCSLLSKLDIWKRIVEPVHTCSLWLIDTWSLD